MLPIPAMHVLGESRTVLIAALRLRVARNRSSPRASSAIHAEQVEARIALTRREQAHLPELADVAEVERRAAVVELDAQVGVLVRHEAALGLRERARRGGAADIRRTELASLCEELTGHAQVEQQAPPVLELRQEVLSAPLERRHHRARELALEPRRRRQEEVAAPESVKTFGDAPAD